MSLVSEKKTQGKYMTVNDTHILILQQAAADHHEFLQILQRCLATLESTQASKREAEARQICLQSAMLMRAVIAARSAAETLERTITHARASEPVR